MNELRGPVPSGGLKNPPLARKCVQTHFQRAMRLFSAIHRTSYASDGFQPIAAWSVQYADLIVNLLQRTFRGQRASSVRFYRLTK